MGVPSREYRSSRHHQNAMWHLAIDIESQLDHHVCFSAGVGKKKIEVVQSDRLMLGKVHFSSFLLLTKNTLDKHPQELTVYAFTRHISVYLHLFLYKNAPFLKEM